MVGQPGMLDLLTHPMQTLGRWSNAGLLKPGDAASAAGHHLLKMVDGVGGLVENAAAYGASKLPDNALSRAIISQNALDNATSNQWESDYQKSTPNTPAAYFGAGAGEVAPFLFSAPAKGLGMLGDAVGSRVASKLPQAVQPVTARAISGATQGAAVGAAQPVYNPTSLADLVTGDQPESYWDQKVQQIGTGAAMGGALPVLGAGARAAYQGAKNAIQPVVNPTAYAARNIANQLGDGAPQIATDLTSAPSYVPGSIATAAQSAPTPKLVMMEKALANANPEFRAKLAEQENANNAARLRAVGNVAQTPQALADAIRARNASTAPMRDFTVTNGNAVPVNSVNGALGSVAYGTPGVSDTIGPAARSMQSKLDSFTSTTRPDTLSNTPGTSTASPAMLDALRQNVNTYLANHAPNGVVGTQEQAAMMPVKGAIVDAINDANPGHKLNQGGWGQGLPQQGPEAPSYRDYLKAFAERSVPINTMEVGQSLQQTLQNKALNSNGDAAATFTNYQSALAKALRQSDFPIDPKAQAALEAVQSDLQRSTISGSIRAPGSDTAYNSGAGKAFLKALGVDTGGNVIPTAAGAAVGAATGSVNAGIAAGFGTKKASGFMANRVGNAMGDLFLDPKRLAAELQAMSQPTAAGMPALPPRLAGKLTPAAAQALLLELQKQQTPSVVGGAQ